LEKCEAYAVRHGFENIDYLLERTIIGEDRFNALVIIDELDEELEKALVKRFTFPVEILVLERYAGPQGEQIFRFDPFLSDVVPEASGLNTADAQIEAVDVSEIDTIVVPAHSDGFSDTFLAENRWYAIRIHGSMKPKIRHIAAYQVAPQSAITYVADVHSIELWKDSNKYVVNFDGPARQIGPIRLVPNGKVKPLYGPRYTSLARLEKAQSLDEAF
jgi:hypothetical protein